MRVVSVCTAVHLALRPKSFVDRTAVRPGVADPLSRFAEVDLITHPRQPQPRLAAVYLLMPTTQNVELVLRDHSPSPPPAQGKTSKKQPQPAVQEPPKYAAAYVNFMEGESCSFQPRCPTAEAERSGAGVSDALVGRLTDGLPDNYLQGLKELYINFHGAFFSSPLPSTVLTPAIAALEPRLFSLRTPHTFFSMYGLPDAEPERALARWDDDIGWMARSVSRVKHEPQL